MTLKHPPFVIPFCQREAKLHSQNLVDIWDVKKEEKKQCCKQPSCPKIVDWWWMMPQCWIRQMPELLTNWTILSFKGFQNNSNFQISLIRTRSSRKHVTQVKNSKEIADLEKLSTNSNPLGLYGQLSPYSPHLWMLCFHKEELNVQCNNTLHKD